MSPNTPGRTFPLVRLTAAYVVQCSFGDAAACPGGASTRKPRPGIYCAAIENPAPDHVPPKSIFPKPRPNDLITVPSCLRCNKGSEKDDEYFKMSLGMRADIEHAPGAAALAQQVMRAWDRDQAKDFTAFVRSTLRIRPIIDNEGREMGRITGQEIDSHRIGLVVGRIARGLYFHEIRKALPSDCRVTGALYDALDQTFRRRLEIALLGSPPKGIANGAFMYAWREASDDSGATMWLMLFYGGAGFVAVTGK